MKAVHARFDCRPHAVSALKRYICRPQVFASGTLFTLSSNISATSPVTQPAAGATYTATFSANPPGMGVEVVFGVAVYTQ